MQSGRHGASPRPLLAVGFSGGLCWLRDCFVGEGDKFYLVSSPDQCHSLAALIAQPKPLVQGRNKISADLLHFGCGNQIKQTSPVEIKEPL
jgi:hypothetical protein